MTLKEQINQAVPSSGSHYGVVFTATGRYNLGDHLHLLTPKSLRVAIFQAIEYERHFGGMAFVIDLRTREELWFDHSYPFTIRGSFQSVSSHHVLSN